MTTLAVMRPRGQRKEVFHDRRIDQFLNDPNTYSYKVTTVTVYSSQVLSGNVLKVYAHEVSMRGTGEWSASTADKRREVAHFRPNQWDAVRCEE
jgi:hypothetical protein